MQKRMWPKGFPLKMQKSIFTKMLECLASKRVVLVLGTLIVFSGVAATHWRLTQEDAQMRADLMIRIKLVAEITNFMQVSSLTGSLADLESPVYLRFKEQLAIVRHADPKIRFIYLTGIKPDGTVFFFVDSEPLESESYSPPGQVYGEASEAFKAAFFNPAGVIEGPGSDRWGTWVSALVPVMNPYSHEPLALLGMDVDAENWTYEIIKQCFPLAAMTLLFATASVFFYLLLRNSEIARRRVVDSETRLYASEERYSIAAQNTGQLVYDTHLASGKILWSGAVEKVTGYSPEEFARVGSCGWMDLIHPDDRKQTLALREHAKATDSPFVADYRFKRKDGGFADISERGGFTMEPSNPEAHLIGVMEDVTQKRQAEKDLREGQRVLSTLMGNLPGMAYRCRNDKSWTMEFVSQGCLELTGYHPEQLILNRQVAYSDIIHPQDWIPVWQQVQGRLAKRIPFDLIYRICCFRGEEKWVWEKGQGVFSDTGELLALEGFITDITEQKRAEAALKVSEENYRRIVETAKEGIWTTNAEFKVTYANSHITEILGYSTDEIQGQPLRAFMFEEDLPDMDRKADARRKGMSEAYERKYRRKDGSTCWVLVSAVPLLDAEGRFTGSLGMMTDITERKLAEKALRESEFRFRSLLNSYSDIVALMDLNGIITETNRSLLRVTGFSSHEFVGRHYTDFIRKQHHETIHKTIESLLKGFRRDEVLDIGFTKKDGSEITLRIRGWLVTGEDSRPVALGVFVQDVTDEMRLIEEKESLQSQLQHAQKMEAIGTLAGGIAHDFNNILSVIMGTAEITSLSELIDSSTREALTTILTASERAKKLIGQILAFSRRERQDRIPLDLQTVGKETISFFRASLPSNIELRHSFDEDIGTVLADPTQMQQVLMNLCTNAMHAIGDENGVLEIKLSRVAVSEIDVKMETEAEPGDFVLLTVADTGHGIDPLTLERIFEPYFTTKPQGRGTGLGLATVHGIVKSHGGFIRVKSEIEHGTKFHVFLPLSAVTQRTVTKPSPQLPTGIERILFVDDEPAIAKLAHQALSRLGYQVETRTSPIEALEAFRMNQEKFDLVITDLAMPQMPGLKLARKLTELQPDLPIIICTGFSDKIHEESARAIGVREILFKPLAMTGLAESVRKALGTAN